MRATSFILLILIAHLTPWWFFLIGALVYIAVWDGYELLILTAFVDAQFSTTSQQFPLPYMYTSVIALLIILGIMIKPHLRFYHTET